MIDPTSFDLQNWRPTLRKIIEERLITVQHKDNELSELARSTLIKGVLYGIQLPVLYTVCTSKGTAPPQHTVIDAQFFIALVDFLQGTDPTRYNFSEFGVERPSSFLELPRTLQERLLESHLPISSLVVVVGASVPDTMKVVETYRRTVKLLKM